mmetsp:Transcript_140605/g.437301  ORF Transcript_140605/g.437301 Transcript_140605/m.437301 type:complete len:219 (+) Transcript_140605:508-1164(+)
MVDQLRDEVKSFLLAGHETSASMLAWVNYELWKNQECRTKVKEEGQRVFTEDNDGTGRSASHPENPFEALPLPPTEKFKECTYTLNALKETLRRHTPVPVVVRQAVNEDTLDGNYIAPGTRMFCSISSVHLDPEVWEAPLEFHPERFEEKHDPNAFLPFIIGPRNCLGQHLALLEARVILSLLTQRFTLTPIDQCKGGEADDYTVPVIPKYGMFVHVT